ncbi:MAG: DUF58 domain-containing protein [Gemmatimonadales bacterium]
MPLPLSYGPLLDALVGVSWPARRLAGAGAAGSHPSRLRGLTAEFTEYRPYRQGDDARRLDWKLLARTDRAYLRITDDHAIRPTILLLDASASLAFPEDTHGKWVQGCRLAVGLAAVARSDGDPVGLIVPGPSGELRLPPRAHRLAVAEIARALDETTPAGSASLVASLDGLRRGSRVVIISDFLDEEQALLERARALFVLGVEVFALHVVAEEERIPPAVTRLAVDPESPLRRTLHDEVREGYVTNFTRWRSALAEAWRRAGAEFTEVRAEEDAAAVIRRIVRGAADDGVSR